LIDDAKAAKAGCPLKYATHKKLAKALKELALFWGRSWEVVGVVHHPLGAFALFLTRQRRQQTMQCHKQQGKESRGKNYDRKEKFEYPCISSKPLG